MASRILVINGHPDPRPERLCAALCDAYARGAEAAGREVRRIDVGVLDVPLIRTAAEFETGSPPPAMAAGQQAIAWADHLVIVHPLWLGGAPALLKAFLEQTFRYGFAIPRPGEGSPLGGLLKGRSARLIVTMGMPALVYRLMFGAFGVRTTERSILGLSGFGPLRRTLIGGVGGRPNPRWLATAEALGRHGA